MASISSKNGRRTIQFASADGPGRKTLRLGKTDMKSANAVRTHIEWLIGSKASNQPVPLETSQWLGGIDAKLHAKLAAIGLVAPRSSDTTDLDAATDGRFELGDFLDGYIKMRTDLKPRTRSNLKQSRNSLVNFFGSRRDIRTVNRAEAKDWKRKIEAGFAEATVAMHIKKARQFFGDAAERKLIGENPFSILKPGSQANGERMFYVPRADIDTVIAACPDAEWRLVFALARYAGLRIPSEAVLLKWADVKWEAGKIIINSPKTAHHRGKGQRTIPLFPELAPHLLDAFEIAPPENQYVLARLRGDNLRTTAEKIIFRSGIAAWPKLFQNLRASCETDLTAEYPIQVACAWIGNSEAVAKRHYLMVTDAHFEQATGIPTSAAKSAADTTGQPRTSPKQNDYITPETSGIPVLSSIGDTPKGSRTTYRLSSNLIVSRQALQKALHRLEIATPYILEAEIAKLQRQLALAKGWAGGVE